MQLQDKTVSLTMPLPVQRSLLRLGRGLGLARRRRHLTQADLAGRIGASVNTIRRLEAGHPGIALGQVARVLQVFGELGALDQLLDTAHDGIGLTLMDERLPQRVRVSKRSSGLQAF
jgi:transcriptional regulator with XRE-family HTH domain